MRFLIEYLRLPPRSALTVVFSRPRARGFHPRHGTLLLDQALENRLARDHAIYKIYFSYDESFYETWSKKSQTLTKHSANLEWSWETRDHYVSQFLFYKANCFVYS